MGTASAQAPPPPGPARRLAEALPVAMTTEGGRPLPTPPASPALGPRSSLSRRRCADAARCYDGARAPRGASRLLSAAPRAGREAGLAASPWQRRTRPCAQRAPTC